MSGQGKPTVGGLDLSGVEWRRGDDERQAGGGRVEVAFVDDGTTLLRDGEHPDGPVLVFTPEEWQAFVEGVKDGEFDLSQRYPGVWRDEVPASDDSA